MFVEDVALEMVGIIGFVSAVLALEPRFDSTFVALVTLQVVGVFVRLAAVNAPVQNWRNIHSWFLGSKVSKSGSMGV